MYCKYCGQKIDDTASFCSSCGARVDEGGSVNQPVVNVYNNVEGGYVHKKKWVAFFLCLLLGEFGIHRFYVGKIFTGIIWLCTLGLCGIGWILDLLVILLGGFKDKASQRLI